MSVINSKIRAHHARVQAVDPHHHIRQFVPWADLGEVWRHLVAICAKKAETAKMAGRFFQHSPFNVYGHVYTRTRYAGGIVCIGLVLVVCNGVCEKKFEVHLQNLETWKVAQAIPT